MFLLIRMVSTFDNTTVFFVNYLYLCRKFLRISFMNTNSILFLSYWYPNKSNKNSGIFVKRHAQAIHINNPVTVLTLHIIKGSSLYKKHTNVLLDEANIETHQVYIESIFNKLFYVLLPLHYFILINYIKKNWPTNTFTLIHSNILFPAAILGYWLAKKLKCKHFISAHWSKLDKFFRVSLYKVIGRRAYNSAHGISVVSASLSNVVKKHTSNNNIRIIPNVIDSGVFNYSSDIQKNKLFTFIAVAHWGVPKNPFLFLDAIKELLAENKLTAFKVVIVGEGPLINLIKERNYPFEMELKGNLNSEKLNVELNKSHVFLHGSDFETFSVVMAEAIMCGLPCVLSPVGIALDVINETNGFVTDNTVADWKVKIQSAYTTVYDYKKISEQLKHKFDSNVVGKLFDDFYKG
jgi:glycosyltransferase involved in cell wall biosynthesis